MQPETLNGNAWIPHMGRDRILGKYNFSNKEITIMRKILLGVFVVLLALGVNSVMFAADQTVQVKVEAFSVISISGGVTGLTITTATPGQDPTDATDATTTYSITTNEESMKITGKLGTDEAFGAGKSLEITLADPDGIGAATVVPNVALTETAKSLMTGIALQYAAAKTITYRLKSTAASGALSQVTKTVTLTIVSEL